MSNYFYEAINLGRFKDKSPVIMLQNSWVMLVTTILKADNSGLVHFVWTLVCIVYLTGCSPSTGSSTQVDQSSGFLQKLKFTVELNQLEGGTRAIPWKEKTLSDNWHEFQSRTFTVDKLPGKPGKANNWLNMCKSALHYQFLWLNDRICLFWSFQL